MSEVSTGNKESDSQKWCHLAAEIAVEDVGAFAQHRADTWPIPDVMSTGFRRTLASVIAILSIREFSLSRVIANTNFLQVQECLLVCTL